MRRMQGLWGARLLVALVVTAPVWAQEQGQRERFELDQLEIIGTTPLPGLGQPLERVPANVQQLSDEDVEHSGGHGAPEVLQRRTGGVHLPQTQNNPLQPDLTYRGFVSSSLLGTPQGLSVFVDGVRVNEFLGDTLNWDLVPEQAISSLQIAPGADPVYGRNTLGGAVAIQTKRGSTHPGTRAEASYGSFQRRELTLETGGTAGSFDYFVLGNLFREDGFRDFSESDRNIVFSSFGWQDPWSDIRLTHTWAGNELRGNAFAPESFLARDRSAIFTYPDIFEPDLHFLNLQASRLLGGGFQLDGSLHYRRLDVFQFNADELDEEEDEENGEEDDDGPIPGVNRRTNTEQRRFGGTFQASLATLPFGGENNLALGVDFDLGSADLRFTEEEGVITPSRTVAGFGERELETDVETDGEAVGVYVTDTLTPVPWASLTVSARYDRIHLEIDDLLGAGASGEHTFERVNPSAGVTIRPRQDLTLFGRYGESFRAPTAVELACASEEDPCSLPVAFAEDPPLDEVRVRNGEAGFRFRPVDALGARIALFWTRLDDDILFVSATRTAGFFRNVDETRRRGVEAFFDGTVGPVEWFANYSLTEATFETTADLPSPVGENRVEPGDELPGVPNHLLSAGFDATLPWKVFAGEVGFGFDLQYVGEQFLRTDEANEQAPLDDYVVANARLSWTRGPVTVFARVENLLDNEYETFGSQGENVFNDGRVERFLSPGAPIGGWGGIRIALGAPTG